MSLWVDSNQPAKGSYAPQSHGHQQYSHYWNRRPSHRTEKFINFSFIMISVAFKDSKPCTCPAPSFVLPSKLERGGYKKLSSSKERQDLLLLKRCQTLYLSAHPLKSKVMALKIKQEGWKQCHTFITLVNLDPGS